MPEPSPAGSRRLGFLGPVGTFSEAALRTLPAAVTATLVPSATVAAAVAAVRDGGVDASLVPLENSVEGSVATTLDELAVGAPVVVAAEVLLPVSFALLARRGTRLEGVRTVATHPHAEAQCRRWLRAVLPEAGVVLTSSTAEAARAVAAGAHDAALSAPVAAEHYALATLATGVGDDPDAVTRFVLVRRPGPPPAPSGADRTTVAAFTDDRPGALQGVLAEFAARGINLTRIESRPSGLGLGRYFFSIDCDGHVAEARVGDALAALQRSCLELRFLGSYPRADGLAPVVPPHLTDAAYARSASWLAGVRGSAPGR